jgi:hypothetical protein
LAALGLLAKSGQVVSQGESSSLSTAAVGLLRDEPVCELSELTRHMVISVDAVPDSLAGM